MKPLIAIVICTVLAYACNRPDFPHSAKLDIALKYARDNVSELEKVIDHYSKDAKDSLKLQAAVFLIENMPGKGYFKYSPRDNRGITSYQVFRGELGIDSINVLKSKYEDSMNCGEIRYVNPVFVEDLQIIRAPQIIENIEYAFRAWEMPWAKSLTFSQFKELILPYRVNDEPLQKWRKYFFENSGWIFKLAGNTHDRLKLASVINDSLKKGYRYIHGEISYFPGTFTLAELKCTKGGRCEDLNMLLGYWLRAIGVPLTREYTSYWANTNWGGHSWLSILDTTGKFVPMNAVYDNPRRDSLPFHDEKLIKAYRNQYEINNFSSPGSFVRKPVTDITTEYIDATDYTFVYHHEDTTRTYISVLNGPYWKPFVTETVIQGDSTVFKNIGTGALYATIQLRGDTFHRTIRAPFLLTKTGKVQPLMMRKDTSVTVSFDLSLVRVDLYKKRCRVIYWDEDLQDWSAGNEIKVLTIDPNQVIKQKKHTAITFNGLPGGTMYKLVDADYFPYARFGGRPFIFNEEERQYMRY